MKGSMIMMTMGIGRYLRWRQVREDSRPGSVLCAYLGCGERATRMAWSRLGSIVPACPDPAHGRSMTP